MQHSLKKKNKKSIFDCTYNEVLKEHHFVVAEGKNPERIGLKEGTRITEEEMSFLMSDSDFKQYLQYAQEKQFERGYIKEDGTYKDGYNGLELKINAENELIKFFISLLQKELQEALSPAMKNYTHKHKLIDLIMNN